VCAGCHRVRCVRRDGGPRTARAAQLTMAAKDDDPAYQRRFARWQSRAPRPTRVLSELLQSSFVPLFEAEDFRRVGVALGRADEPVDRNAMRLERERSAHIDSVDFSFDNYQRPRFQISFSRRRRTFPNEFLRSASLAARSSQYYHFWGKPSLLPLWLWSDGSASREVAAVIRTLDQVLRFLETGERGPNIGIPFENPWSTVLRPETPVACGSHACRGAPPRHPRSVFHQIFSAARHASIRSSSLWASASPRSIAGR
jgi:hypothetical protein